MTIWKPEDYLQFPVGVMLTVIGGSHSKECSALCTALMIQEISSDTKRNSSLIKGTTKGNKHSGCLPKTLAFDREKP